MTHPVAPKYWKILGVLVLVALSLMVAWLVYLPSAKIDFAGEYEGSRLQRVWKISRIIQAHRSLPSSIEDARLVHGNYKLGGISSRQAIVGVIHVDPSAVSAWLSSLPKLPSVDYQRVAVGTGQLFPPFLPDFLKARQSLRFDERSVYDASTLFVPDGKICNARICETDRGELIFWFDTDGRVAPSLTKEAGHP